MAETPSGRQAALLKLKTEVRHAARLVETLEHELATAHERRNNTALALDLVTHTRELQSITARASNYAVLHAYTKE